MPPIGPQIAQDDAAGGGLVFPSSNTLAGSHFVPLSDGWDVLISLIFSIQLHRVGM